MASSDSPSNPKRTSSASTASTSMESENPFITFRRFADSQVSSLLQSIIGLPSLFSQPDLNDPWQSFDGFATKCRESRVRTPQDLIDMLERDIQRATKDMHSTLMRREQEMQKWGAFFDAAKADRPNEIRNPKTDTTSTEQERLGWDGQLKIREEKHKANQASKDHEERFIVPTSAGSVNFRRVVDHQDEGQGFWIEQDDPRLEYNTVTDRDPFAQPDQSIAWLLTDDYSPLYLDHSLPYKLHPSFYKTDTNDSFFSRNDQPGDGYPRFASESIKRHDPRLAQKVDWRAAFHDLLEVHHKGTLTPFPPLTRKLYSPASMNPGRWISYLVDHGSLGPKWRRASDSQFSSTPYRFRYGKSADSWIVSSFLGERFVRDRNWWCLVPRFGTYERKNDALAMIASSSDSSNIAISRALDTRPANEAQTLLLRNKTGDQTADAPTTTSKADVQAALSTDGFDPACPTSPRPASTTAFTQLARNPASQATRHTMDRVSSMIEKSGLEGPTIGDMLQESFDGFAAPSPEMLREWFEYVDDFFRAEPSDACWTEHEMTVDRDVEHGGHSARPNSDAMSDGLDSPHANSNGSSLDSTSSSRLHNTTTTPPPASLTSTLTTLHSRTLPDGRTETTRVLARRFADGREERTESVETLSRSGRDDPHCSVVEASVSDEHDSAVAVFDQAGKLADSVEGEEGGRRQEDEEEEDEEKGREMGKGNGNGARGGWFWR